MYILCQLFAFAFPNESLLSGFGNISNIFQLQPKGISFLEAMRQLKLLSGDFIQSLVSHVWKDFYFLLEQVELLPSRKIECLLLKYLIL